MSDNSESRKYPRSASLRRCGIVSPAYDAPVQARIINHSAYGVLLELDYPLPVEDVLIKIFQADETSGVIDYERADFMLGMVRWCNQQMGGWSGMFQAGVELISIKPRKDVI